MIALAAVLVFASAPQHVIDDAQILQPATRDSLETSLADFQKRWGVEIDVVTESSLGGITAEDRTTQMLMRYDVGDHTRSQGVVLGVFPADRKAAINMANGTTILTPQDCQNILDGSVLPAFHAGSYDRGVMTGAAAIELAFQGRKPAPASAYHPAAARPFFSTYQHHGSHVTDTFGTLLVFGIVVVFSILRSIMFPGSYYYGRGWRRGGWNSWSSGSSWGGSSGGGGGWSSGSSSFGGGGGGGFSGGGASGSW